MADQTDTNGPQNPEKSPEEYKNIGNEYYKKQQYSEAIANYTKAIGIKAKALCACILNVHCRFGT